MYRILQPFQNLPLTTRRRDENLRRREPVLRVLFNATFGILTLSLLSLLLAYFTDYNRLVLTRIVAVTVALLTVLGLRLLLKLRHYFIAAYGILGIYWALATIMAMHWGVTLPLVLLLYSAIIVLSGMVLGAGSSILALLGSIVVLFIIEYAVAKGHLHPDTSWNQQSARLTDLIGYYFVFVILGVSSWLFNRQTDRALHHALRAEVALQREKASLETKVEARTRELEAAQMQKIQQLHRFTELGQFSTSLLHDLANHISTLSVDIEGMGEKEHYQSQVQIRIKRRIAYIDTMMQWAYDHINGKVKLRQFTVKREIAGVNKMLQHKARAAHVQITTTAESTPPLALYGDANRFRQLMANLVSNAIDAYGGPASTADKEVRVEVTAAKDTAVCITVRDWGSGIPAAVQDKIFDPFYTTKYDGMGIGLFIVKQIVEDYFAGSITLSSKEGETSFSVTLHGTHHE